MLFNEPKLLKLSGSRQCAARLNRFSALQRAEIAEINHCAAPVPLPERGFSALQRAEIAEILVIVDEAAFVKSFSALQRAEIAEIIVFCSTAKQKITVSVLFNEPKLLKYPAAAARQRNRCGFSALQRAEIAEMFGTVGDGDGRGRFQCSSTSRNC